jgi:RNA-binding protein YhbY
MPIGTLQIGKQKVTPNFIETLKKQFENKQTVKISVLRSARESKEDVKKYSEEILEELGGHYTARIIGFTIVLKKWRKKAR